VSDWQEMVDGRYAIVGSPETVTEQLVECLGALGTGNLLGLFQLGSLPADLTRASLTRFAEQVMPRLREEFPDTDPVLRTSAVA
jgi:alkanesulfonate monooxygenase SsuD/methylene tetrahydromethanopterin reductase-like flavin-dependent oxidoreductase (luciferase family)